MVSFRQSISHGNKIKIFVFSIFSETTTDSKFPIVAEQMCELCTFGSVFQQVRDISLRLLTSIRQKMSEAIHESELPSPAFQSQIDSVYTRREVVLHIHLLCMVIGGGKGLNKVVVN